MHARTDKSQENENRTVAHEPSQKTSRGEATFEFVDNRVETAQLTSLQEAADSSPNQADRLRVMTSDNPRRVTQRLQLGSSNSRQPVQRFSDWTALLALLGIGVVTAAWLIRKFGYAEVGIAAEELVREGRPIDAHDFEQRLRDDAEELGENVRMPPEELDAAQDQQVRPRYRPPGARVSGYERPRRVPGQLQDVRGNVVMEAHIDSGEWRAMRDQNHLGDWELLTEINGEMFSFHVHRPLIRGRRPISGQVMRNGRMMRCQTANAVIDRILDKFSHPEGWS